MSQSESKKRAAEAALAYIPNDSILGVGTGSTVHYLIDALPSIKSRIRAVVSSSENSTQKLKALGFSVMDLNHVDEVSLYIDGADEVNPHRQLIKGGGAALTREKIIASAAKKFLCIVDESKCVDVLGAFPLPVEVIPMARSYVARELLKLGGNPEYREGVITDNGNVILDVYHLKILDPMELEKQINNIAGVVCNGIFAQRAADQVLVGTQNSVQILS